MTTTPQYRPTPQPVQTTNQKTQTKPNPLSRQSSEGAAADNPNPNLNPNSMLPHRRNFTPARACHKAGEMNRYESDYSALLETRKQNGEITAYFFERYKLKLGNNCYYTPDFMVVRADGVLEFHEVKGYWEEDARVKIKAAADMYPHIFVAVTRPSRKADRERNPWNYEYFTKEEQ